jgi:hypothetical protein
MKSRPVGNAVSQVFRYIAALAILAGIGGVLLPSMNRDFASAQSTIMYFNYIGVNLSSNTCTGSNANPLFANVPYCVSGQITNMSGPCGASPNAANMIFGGGMSYQAASMPAVFVSAGSQVAGPLQPVVWSGATSPVTYWISSVMPLSAVTITLFCW